MALIEARTFTSGADMTAHFKAIRSKLWKATGIYDPNKMTNSQRIAAERKIEREREIAELKRRQDEISRKATAEIDAMRLAEMAHPIIPRKAGAIQGTPKAKLIEMCKAAGVDYYDIIGTSRRDVIVQVRHRLVGQMYRLMTADGREFSLQQMGLLFKKDHSTIVNSLRRCGILEDKRPLKGKKTPWPQSGHKGIVTMPNGKHRAEIWHSGLKYSAGTYDTLEQAITARVIMMKSIDAKNPMSVWDVYRIMGVFK